MTEAFRMSWLESGRPKAEMFPKRDWLRRVDGLAFSLLETAASGFLHRDLSCDSFNTFCSNTHLSPYVTIT
jgi:hypothetical protein